MLNQNPNHQNWGNQPLRPNSGGGGGFTPNLGGMGNLLGNLAGAFPSAMGGAMQQIGAINARNQANGGKALDRELEAYIAQLRSGDSRYQSDAYERAQFVNSTMPAQAGIYNTDREATAQENTALAQLLASIGSSQNQAMGQYLGAMPGAQAQMATAPIAANAQRDVANIQGMADIAGAAIPAQLQYALAPAQMASAERIAASNNAPGLANAQASMYGARQGAMADMYGSRAGADASMYNANQGALASMLESQLGFRGLQDTNNAARYGSDNQLTANALNSQLQHSGTLDTNRTNQNIAGIGAQASVLGDRLGLEGTRATADASKFGSQQNALASMLQSGSALQLGREQERGKSQRFNQAGGLFNNMLGRISTTPQFGGFRTSYGSGVSF
jgi:hypothetical protein